ncbi:MAG: alanyl-tRNA editing protein [Marinosulfonomonas sp.]
MTEPLFHHDSYRKQAHGLVTAHTPEGGVILDKTLFCPQGGGQPGDNGDLSWGDGSLVVATAIRGENDAIILIPGSAGNLPAVGTPVLQTLDWDRRYRHMRLHTALHLLSVSVPFPVIGCAIGQSEGWLDLKMPTSTIDRVILHESLNEYVAQDLPVTQSWGTVSETEAETPVPMAPKPSLGQGETRLIHIGTGDQEINRQPCLGTHVAHTREIGKLTVGTIDDLGRNIRRIHIQIDHNT